MTSAVPFPATSLPSSVPYYAPKSTTNHNRDRRPDPPTQPGALSLYVKALRRALPRKSTIVSWLKSCSLSDGRAIHAQIFKIGLGSDRFLGSCLVRLYSDHGLLFLARRVFDGIPKKDVALRTAVLTGYVSDGDVEGARELFDEMPERDVVAWNAMISGYAQCGHAECALQLFRDMQLADVKPNEVTLVSALSACSQLGCLALGEWIHAYVNRDPSVQQTPALHNSLLHMYAKCGRLGTALELFVEQETKNLESWNTMLTCLAIHGCGTGAMSVFSQMTKSGVFPDRITFIGLLMACSHGGMLEHARKFFDCMSRVYGVEPGTEHYGCMVDALSRSGQLDEAYTLIKASPFDADECMWGALLSGCYMHCNYELGLEAARTLLELQPWDESRYIALSNLCMLSGKMDEAVKARKKMFAMGINMSSGSSTIEVDGIVYEFIAGDRSHYQTKDINLMTRRAVKHLEPNVCAHR